MVKKIRNVLLATAECAILIVGGTNITAFAEGMVSECPHEFYTVEYAETSFEEYDDNVHRVCCFEEIYCWDCGCYIPRTYVFEESHDYSGSNICIVCGHAK